jgi:hypothetical protein
MCYGRFLTRFNSGGLFTLLRHLMINKQSAEQSLSTTFVEVRKYRDLACCFTKQGSDLLLFFRKVLDISLLYAFCFKVELAELSWLNYYECFREPEL